MHELPVAQNILEIGLKHAREANAHKITKIHLVIGQFSSIIDDSILFYWDLISKGTLAEGSVITFKRIPAQFECLDCHATVDWDQIQGECPHCHSARLKLLTGTEFFIESIEVE